MTAPACCGECGLRGVPVAVLRTSTRQRPFFKPAKPAKPAAQTTTCEDKPRNVAGFSHNGQIGNPANPAVKAEILRSLQTPQLRGLQTIFNTALPQARVPAAGFAYFAGSLSALRMWTGGRQSRAGLRTGDTPV